MPQSKCYFIKRVWEFVPIDDLLKIPTHIRGLYVLYQKESDSKLNVVYIGMARGDKSGARGRLISHKKSKPELWDCCSVFEVWDNITKEQVQELEGLFRHIFRKDSQAQSLKLNKQRVYKPLQQLKRNTTVESKARKLNHRGE